MRCILLTSLTLTAAAVAADATVTTVEGRRVRLSDVSVAADWTVSGDEAGERRTFAGQDLQRLRFPSEAPPVVPRSAHLLLASGEVVAGAVPQTEDEEFVVVNRRWGRLRVPLGVTRAAVLQAGLGESAGRSLWQRLKDAPVGADRALLANGDQVAGVLLGIDEGQVTFDRDGRSAALPRDGVRAVALDPALLDYPMPAGLHARVRTADGSVLDVTEAATRADALAITTAFGAELELPLVQVVDLTFRGGRISYLSDLEPLTAEYTPYLGAVWPLRNDGCVAGGPLRIADRTYDRGLGTASRSEITYAVAGHRMLRALVGLDRQAGNVGSVQVRVKVDGEIRHDSGVIDAAAGPKPIAVDLTGAETVTLVTDFGRRGAVRDWVDWCDAVLVK